VRAGPAELRGLGWIAVWKANSALIFFYLRLSRTRFFNQGKKDNEQQKFPLDWCI
jgi:hypothetical protein